MKTLLSDSGDYKVYVEVNSYLRSDGGVELKFTSKWDSAKNPDEEQVRFRTILTAEQRKILKDLL